MAINPQLLTFILLILDLILFLVLLIRTVTNMYARGARSLLAIIFALLYMLLFHTGALLVRSPETRLYLFTFELFFFMILPLTMVLMTYEMSDVDTKKAWKVIGPMFIVNFFFFAYLQMLRDPGPPAYSYHNCMTTGFLTDCEGVFRPITFVFFTLLLLEIIGGVVYLIWYYFRYPNTKDRAQFLVLALSVLAIPLITGVIVLIFGADLVSPMPVAIGVMAVMLFVAVYNYKALTFTREETETVNMVDDVLLVVNNDHIIQDFNLSTLKVFGKQVKDMVNVKLEHAFIEYPKLVELFQYETASGELELNVDGDIHTFEPSLVSVTGSDEGDIVGKRLQLRDVTKQETEPDTFTVIRDRLTNQYKKESFYALGRRLYENAKRANQDVAMVVLDIDDFQTINNRYTYVVGDEALVQLVDLIHSVIRSSDLLARFDSDNFVILMPRADENTAYQLCTRIKEAVATNIFKFEGQQFQFTVSQGYTVYEGRGDYTLEGLYETARAALMTSRGQGRNRLAYKELRRM